MFGENVAQSIYHNGRITHLLNILKSRPPLIFKIKKLNLTNKTIHYLVPLCLVCLSDNNLKHLAKLHSSQVAFSFFQYSTFKYFDSIRSGE